MCGIFGFAGFDEPGALARMGLRLRHRGPDDEGFYEHGDVHLGMRRLAIIDVAGGRQPAFSEDGAVAAVYNGEIYNFEELMASLTDRGHRFTTRCDTEVIVHAWEDEGVACVHGFKGMFAFALHDRRDGSLTLARDRTGMKPLYYHWDGARLVFASEIKAILECAHVPRRPNRAAVDAYLALRYVPNPATMFEGIYCLPAGHHLRLVDGRLDVRRWWDVPLSAGPYLSQSDALDAFDECFERSVRRHMISDVPIGAYLSAGIDSSAIVATMGRLGAPARTFALGFGAPTDETADARALAERLGCEHTEVICRPEHFELLPKMIWHLERPIGDALILAYYLLAQETSRHVKVVLAGEGADELFAGYSFHKVLLWTERYRRLVPGAFNRRVVAEAVRRAPVDLLDRFFTFPANLGREGRARVADFLAGYDQRGLYGNYTWLRTLFSPADRDALYSDAFRDAPKLDTLAAHEAYQAGRPLADPRSAPFLDRLLALQFDDWLQDFALLRQDKSSMAHSLELRLPFLDADLVDLSFRLPRTAKVRGLRDKVIERTWAERVLPPENTRRKKNPFYLPAEFFFDQPSVARLIDATLSPDAVRRRGYFDPQAVAALLGRMADGREFLVVKQVMALVILELWHQIFIDGQAP
ncbi:MAG: asparagine synthase (glutamine-hydrolyzing) [Ardenticatenales bacterium]